MPGNKYLVSSAFLAILVLSAFLFLSNLGVQEFYGDNVGYAFRSIGYLDYLGTGLQTQPVDWYADNGLPWWTALSFHDHPPLLFLIQHVFFEIFGATPFTARLPSLIFGLGAIILFYFLVLRLFASSRLALFSALAFGSGTGSVAMFRSALIEPVQMALILLAVYAFFVFLGDKKYFWFLGLSFGLLMLAKYTGIFLVLAAFLYLVFFERRVLRGREFWLAVTAAVVVFSPVVIYNILLFADRGHFDLQLASLFRQEVAAWPESSLLGKTQDRFSDIFKNARDMFDPAVLGLAVLGALLVCGFKFRPNIVPADWRKPVGFFTVYIAILVIMLVFVGAAHRFLFLGAPVIALLTGFGAELTLRILTWRRAARILVALIFVFMIWYSYRANVIQTVDYGIVKLDKYFSAQFEGRPSGIIPETTNPHLNRVIHDFAAEKPAGLPHFSVIVYNDNVDLTTILWVYARRFFYENIPTMDIVNFQQILAKEGRGYFKGFTIYFVQSGSDTLFNKLRGKNDAADSFEGLLIAQDMSPAARITGGGGREFFRVYKFEL